MLSEQEYYLDLYQTRAKRLRRNTYVLVFILGLVTVNGLTTIFKLNDYKQQLPMVLYDYTVKYEKVILHWWFNERNDAHKEVYSDIHDKPVKIIFDNGYGNENTSVYWLNIPFLTAYLEKNLPNVQSGQNLFDYNLDYPLYLFVISFIPFFILLWVFVDIRSLRGLRNKILGHEDNALLSTVTGSVLFTNTEIRKKRNPWQHAIIVFVVLVSLSILIPVFSIGSHDNTKLDIQGSLFLNPPAAPNVKVKYLRDNQTYNRSKQDKSGDVYTNILLFQILGNFILSIFIAVQVYKITDHEIK